ncbi:hypothetical protein TVAGG3_0288410, partial [Trichomonas vaginalis G3]
MFWTLAAGKNDKDLMLSLHLENGPPTLSDVVPIVMTSFGIMRSPLKSSGARMRTVPSSLY